MPVVFKFPLAFLNPIRTIDYSHSRKDLQVFAAAQCSSFCFVIYSKRDQMSSFICKVQSNDPALCSVSLMGRTNSEQRLQRERLQPKLTPLRRVACKSFPEQRRPTRRHHSPKGANPAMDILRGVYTLTQVRWNCNNW